MRTLGQLRHAARSSLAKATTLLYDRRRGSPSARGYGRYWERRRAIQLRIEPLCRHCKARGLDVPATDVDHIVSKAKGGADEFANYQSLCHACHSAKTVREDGALCTGRYDGLQSVAGEQSTRLALLCLNATRAIHGP